MKLAVCLSTLVLLLGSVAHASDEVSWRRDVANAVKDAQQGNRLLLVFITGPVT